MARVVVEALAAFEPFGDRWHEGPERIEGVIEGRRLAENRRIDAKQHFGVLVRGPADHDPVDVGEVRLSRPEVARAAVDDDRPAGMGALEFIDQRIVERRDGAVVLGAEALEPGFARVHDERLAAEVQLNEIAVGPIVMRNVGALVARPGALEESLLGMSFLERLKSYTVERGRLKGLSQGWPGQNGIPPYIRSPQERAKDFELVNQGYLGYTTLGYSAREVDLLVWLETLRDKQCEDRACELGVPRPGHEPKGGCPVKIHIPEMLRLLGTGKFSEALELIESCNPLPDVTGRVCPQGLQCQGVCTLTGRPIEIGQLEWFLPEREKLAKTSRSGERLKGYVSPWARAEKPPIAVIGSGPAGLINAYLLAAEGFPVTIFEAFHELGGVLRYGIPEFRLPNSLIDDVVRKIRLLGGRFITNFVVGKTATLEDLKAAGFWKIFVGTGTGLPRFMNVPGEHLLGVMSANEFLTRVNLMQARLEDYETPLPEVKDKNVIVIGGGNTAMDAARTAKRLGGMVTIVYRRTQAEMPARVEELHHALEEGIELMVLRAPREFTSEKSAHVCHAILDVMELGPPDGSSRRSPVATGKTETMPVDLVIMALGNASNPIIKALERREDA